MKWLVLIAILAFIASQITRLRPSARDAQLQKLRQSASRSGLLVRFWTLRSSGLSLRKLPESGFVYILPWPHGSPVPSRWALYLSEQGECSAQAGSPPGVAYDWLNAFQQQFPAGWALLESAEGGVSVLWQERGTEKDIEALAAAMRLLLKSL